jgi:hypothetical protein
VKPTYAADAVKPIRCIVLWPPQNLGPRYVFQPKDRKHSMKHPTPSDFIVNVKESHVSVIFKPSDSYYSFGRLADPEDIAGSGPTSLRLFGSNSLISVIAPKPSSLPPPLMTWFITSSPLG